MSDDKKTERPLQDTAVEVTAIPKDPDSPEHNKTAERIQEKLEEKVKKVLKDNQSGGKEKQFEAVESEVKKAKESADPQQIEQIDVVAGGTNEDGDKEARVWSVKPSEKKPAP